MTKVLAFLALSPMLVGPAIANPCAVCRKAAVKKVVKEVIVKKEVAAIGFQVAVPVYLAQVVPAPSISYNITTPPPPAQPVQQLTTYAAPTVIQPITPALSIGAYQQQVAAVPQQQQQTDPLLALLQKMDQRLCSLEEKSGLALKSGAAIPRGLNRCAACHSESTAATKGGKFVLWDKGTLAKLDDAQLRKISTHVMNRTMPPRSNEVGIQPLTDGDIVEIMQWVGQPK